MTRIEILNSKWIVFLFVLLGHSLNAESQTISLSEVTNAVHKDKATLGTDTVVYIISEAFPFFDTSNKANAKIKILSLTKRQFLNVLEPDRDLYVLIPNLIKVGANLLTIRMAIYKANKNTFSSEPEIYIFYDERTIECKLNVAKKKWEYSKTISIR